jgi:hypothetical protein
MYAFLSYFSEIHVNIFYILVINESFTKIESLLFNDITLSMFREVDNVEIQYIKSILYFNSQSHYFILFSVFHPLGLFSNDRQK